MRQNTNSSSDKIVDFNLADNSYKKHVHDTKMEIQA